MKEGYAFLKLADGSLAVVKSDYIVSTERKDGVLEVRTSEKVYECISASGDVTPRGDDAERPEAGRVFEIVEDESGRKGVLVGGQPGAPAPPGATKRRIDDKSEDPAKREDFVYALPVILVERGAPVRFFERPRPCDCEYPTLLAVNPGGDLTFVLEDEAETGQWCVLGTRYGMEDGPLPREERALQLLTTEAVVRRYSNTTEDVAPIREDRPRGGQAE